MQNKEILNELSETYPQIISMIKIRKATMGLLAIVCVSCLAMGATVGVYWEKSQVIPVIMVKPSISGFVPIEGSSISNTWSKKDVTPVLIVKPSIGGFQPYEGSPIGNTWQKKNVTPVMLVEPYIGKFKPLSSIIKSNGGTDSPPQPPTQQSVVESTIDGTFEGWDGETIFKLSNGQIWQQIEYHYHYHYAYMPKVIIAKSGVGYKMKVSGVQKAISVKRLK
jgi:hypothetical protein